LKVPKEKVLLFSLLYRFLKRNLKKTKCKSVTVTAEPTSTSREVYLLS
jgi:hypothetical protein